MEVYDLEGSRLAGTVSRNNEETHIVRIFAQSAAQTQEMENKWFMKILDEERDMYALIAYGDAQYTYPVAKIAVNQ